jgi:hypothetical protein
MIMPEGPDTEAPGNTKIPVPNVSVPALINELADTMLAAGRTAELLNSSVRPPVTRVPVNVTLAPGKTRTKPITVAPVMHCSTLRSRISAFESVKTPLPVTCKVPDQLNAFGKVDGTVNTKIRPTTGPSVSRNEALRI